jgi:hypothetical protein
MNIGRTTNRGEGWMSQYQILVFNTTSGTPNYIHFKTNVPNTIDKIVMIEAIGYNYGNSQSIRCTWTFYAYNSLIYDRGRETVPGTGLTADGIYASSDGYACIRAYSSQHYFTGFILNAHSSGGGNMSYGTDVGITAVNQNSTSGNYY